MSASTTRTLPLGLRPAIQTRTRPPHRAPGSPWWRELWLGLRAAAEAPAARGPWYLPRIKRLHAPRDRAEVRRWVPTYDQLQTHNAIYAINAVPPQSLTALYRYEQQGQNRRTVLQAIARRMDGERAA